LSSAISFMYPSSSLLITTLTYCCRSLFSYLTLPFNLRLYPSVSPSVCTPRCLSLTCYFMSSSLSVPTPNSERGKKGTATKTAAGQVRALSRYIRPLPLTPSNQLSTSPPLPCPHPSLTLLSSLLSLRSQLSCQQASQNRQ
jgi:hypothetical protein